MQATRHELFSELEDHITNICVNYNLERNVSEQIALNITDFLADNFGGQVICIPKNFYYKLAQRDLDIYNDFTGNNYSILVRKYKMTESGIRKVINRVRKRIIKEKQADLFSEQ